MSVPTYDKFIEPILRILAKHPDGIYAKEAHEAAAQYLKLTEEDKNELLPSGLQQIYKNRSGWAHDRLKRAGLSSSKKRGLWQLTSKGLEYANTNPSPISDPKIDQIAIGFMDVRLSPAQDATPLQPTDEIAQNTPLLKRSPDEILSEAVLELRKSAKAELLESLLNVSPTYFEIIVLDLLHKLGYGTNRSDLQRVGGSGDGGIDGIISLDKLGLEKVYIQAKRWQNTVGRPEIQAFYGALAGQRASKGVFITTSGYTHQAIEYAKSVEKIVLIDGIKLADLMIDFEVGITNKVVKIPKIDTDYFNED